MTEQWNITGPGLHYGSPEFDARLKEAQQELIKEMNIGEILHRETPVVGKTIAKMTRDDKTFFIQFTDNSIWGAYLGTDFESDDPMVWSCYAVEEILANHPEFKERWEKKKNEISDWWTEKIERAALEYLKTKYPESSRGGGISMG